MLTYFERELVYEHAQYFSHRVDQCCDWASECINRCFDVCRCKLCEDHAWGRIRNALMKVLMAVDENITQTMFGMPITKFHCSTKIRSNTLAIIVNSTANVIMVLGSVSLKNLWYNAMPMIKVSSHQSQHRVLELSKVSGPRLKEIQIFVKSWHSDAYQQENSKLKCISFICKLS